MNNKNEDLMNKEIKLNPEKTASSTFYSVSENKFEIANYLETDVNDEKLLSRSKEEIIKIKNKKIEEQNLMISELIKENEMLQEKYAESVSFFKHYIDMLENRLQDQSHLQANVNEIQIESSTDYGQFEKCEYCEEIMIHKEIQIHMEQLLDLKEMEYKITSKDYEGIKCSIEHGYDTSLLIDKSLSESK